MFPDTRRLIGESGGLTECGGLSPSSLACKLVKEGLEGGVEGAECPENGLTPDGSMGGLL